MSDDLTQRLPSSQDGILAQILTTVQNLSAKIENIDQRLGSLERKVEERLYDTRPIWEKVQTHIAGLQANMTALQSDIAALQEGQRILQEGQEALRGEVKELRKELHNMDRRLSVLNDNTIQAQANYRELYDRVYDLEKQRP